MTIIGDYWLPPEKVDSRKLKPMHMNPDEYDQMHTALTTMQKWAATKTPQELEKAVGSVKVGGESDITASSSKIKPVIPPIYRANPDGDIWRCHDCKDRGDKWYMQDHRCSQSRVDKLAWFRIKQGQRKAARIRKLQGENQRIA